MGAHARPIVHARTLGARPRVGCLGHWHRAIGWRPEGNLAAAIGRMPRVCSAPFAFGPAPLNSCSSAASSRAAAASPFAKQAPASSSSPAASGFGARAPAAGGRGGAFVFGAPAPAGSAPTFTLGAAGRGRWINGAEHSSGRAVSVTVDGWRACGVERQPTFRLVPRQHRAAVWHAHVRAHACSRRHEAAPFF